MPCKMCLYPHVSWYHKITCEEGLTNLSFTDMTIITPAQDPPEGKEQGQPQSPVIEIGSPFTTCYPEMARIQQQ